jgi:hypothetical protein
MSLGSNLQGSMTVDFQGKAGSYRQNVTLNIQCPGVSTSYPNYILISSAWSFFENGVSYYTTTTNSSTNPTFYSN